MESTLSKRTALTPYKIVFGEKLTEEKKNKSNLRENI